MHLREPSKTLINNHRLVRSSLIKGMTCACIWWYTFYTDLLTIFVSMIARVARAWGQDKGRNVRRVPRPWKMIVTGLLFGMGLVLAVLLVGSHGAVVPEEDASHVGVWSHLRPLTRDKFEDNYARRIWNSVPSWSASWEELESAHTATTSAFSPWNIPFSREVSPRVMTAPLETPD